MNVNSKLGSLTKQLRGSRKQLRRDPRIVMRAILGVLLVANIAAALLLFRPWAASPEELTRRLSQLRGQVEQKQLLVERLRTLMEKSHRARDEGDAFMDEYFLDARTASSTIIAELKDYAEKANVKQEEHAFSSDPIEGSDDLYMMTISGNYAGEYNDLLQFVNLIDRSPQFLILDTLTASPERTGSALKMNFKMNALILEGKGLSQVQEATAVAEEGADIESDKTKPNAELAPAGVESEAPPTEARTE